MKKILGMILVTALLFCICSTSVFAADVDWPTGPVTIYVGAQPGSNMDVKARLVAKYLTDELDQPVVIENRAGAGGITACTQFLSEEPNSNSIQYMAASYVAVAPIYNEVEYTPDDFITVAGVDTVQNGFFARADLGVNSIEELKDWGEGKVVKFASTGIGSDTFLLSRALMDMLELKSDTVVSDGFPSMLVDTVAGNTDITYCALETARQYVEDGSLIPLAVCNEEAYTGYADEGFEEVPSLVSLDYDIQYATISWFALRAGTDDAVVEKLANALETVYANEDFQKEILDAGFFMLEDTSTEAVADTVEQLTADCLAFSENIQ